MPNLVKTTSLCVSLLLCLNAGGVMAADAVTTTTTSTNTTSSTTSTGNPSAVITTQAAATTATTSNPATAQIAVAPAVLTGKDYIKTSFLPTELRGKYQGYQYSLQNKQPYHLEILQAEVLNGQDEAYVAQEEAQKAQGRKRLFGGLLKVASAVPFTGGLGYGSIGAYRAAAITSNIASVAGNTLDNSANYTTVNVSNQYLRSFNNKIINPNQTFQFLTLVPKGPSPKLRVTFRNLETNQILDFEE